MSGQCTPVITCATEAVERKESCSGCRVEWAVADAVQAFRASQRGKQTLRSSRRTPQDVERLFKRPEERIERLPVEAKPKNAKYPQRAYTAAPGFKICREELAKRDADEDCVEDIGPLAVVEPVPTSQDELAEENRGVDVLEDVETKEQPLGHIYSPGDARFIVTGGGGTLCSRDTPTRTPDLQTPRTASLRVAFSRRA